MRKTRQQWGKPTAEEEIARSTMKQALVTVCGICWKQDDRITSDTNLDKNIDWLGCEICGQWVHESCAAARCNTETESFICSYCLQSNNLH